jgi:hypothetical protein
MYEKVGIDAGAGIVVNHTTVYIFCSILFPQHLLKFGYMTFNYSVYHLKLFMRKYVLIRSFVVTVNQRNRV